MLKQRTVSLAFSIGSKYLQKILTRTKEDAKSIVPHLVPESTAVLLLTHSVAYVGSYMQKRRLHARLH